MKLRSYDVEKCKQEWVKTVGTVAVKHIECNRSGLLGIRTTFHYPGWLPDPRQGPSNATSRRLIIGVRTHLHATCFDSPHDQILNATCAMWSNVVKAAAGGIKISTVAVNGAVQMTVLFLEV